jgi:3-hydroxyacyl-CoA dehydrogenase
MLESYGREAMRLILEGATPAQIDKVLFDFGFTMGFPSMADLVGIDVGYLVREQNKEAFYATDPANAAICNQLYKLGRYGQKSGRGFYIYEARDKRDDPEVMAIAAELAADYSVERREISDQEILERTVYMLINEGAQILDEGIAIRASDIDIVYCNGYGFPTHRGGSMHYANEVGLKTILGAINKYRNELGPYGEKYFKPAPLLEKMVVESRSF